jgi:hypothetical protein
MRIFIVLFFAVFLLGNANAQDKTYNTDDLKKMKRITADEWKRLQEEAGQKAQKYATASTSDVGLQAIKGRTAIKADQTLDLKNETDVVFDYLISGGQDTKGNLTAKARYAFKIGPGKFEIKNGLIKRVE